MYYVSSQNMTCLILALITISLINFVLIRDLQRKIKNKNESTVTINSDGIVIHNADLKNRRKRLGYERINNRNKS